MSARRDGASTSTVPNLDDAALGDPWSYRPGSWFGVVGASVTLLLPGTEKSRVAELWALVDDGAVFDEVLDSVLRSGLGSLPGFVLVGQDDGLTKILVRGASVSASATAAGESVELSGAGAVTWVERTLEDVTALTVSVDESAGAVHDAAGPAAPDGSELRPDLPILGGLVRVGRLDHPAVTVGTPPAPHGLAEPAAPVDEAALVDQGSHAPRGEHVAGPPPPYPAPEPPAPPPPAVSPAPDTPAPETPAPPPPPSWAGPPPPAATGEQPVVPRPPEGRPGEGQQPGADHDGLTRAGIDPGEFERPQPGIPGQPAPPSVVSPVAKLVVADGETVPVDRVVLIGRAPEARRFTSTDQPRLVTVPSPLHEISSTHVEVRPGSGADHGSAVVTDMGSTNGTVLEQPGLGPEDLKPGVAVQLIPGARINLGDGVSIQVSRP